MKGFYVIDKVLLPNAAAQGSSEQDQSGTRSVQPDSAQQGSQTSTFVFATTHRTLVKETRSCTTDKDCQKKESQEEKQEESRENQMQGQQMKEKETEVEKQVCRNKVCIELEAEIEKEPRTQQWSGLLYSLTKQNAINPTWILRKL